MSETNPKSEGSSAAPTGEAEAAENLRRGHLEAEAGRPDQAARFYERVLRDDPGNPVAHHRLAVLADQAGDFASAERHYLAVLDVRRDDPDVLNDLGYSYLLQHRYPEAERVLREAIAADPSHERALTNLGLLYAVIGDNGRAMAVLRLTGTEDEARRKLAALRPQAGTSSGAPLSPGLSADGAIVRTGGVSPSAAIAVPAPVSPLATIPAARDPAEPETVARRAEAERPFPSQRAAGRLPGLIEPTLVPAPASPPAPIDLPTAPQPYLRGISAGGPMRSGPMNSVRPSPDAATANVERATPPQDAAESEALPLWTPPASAAAADLPLRGYDWGAQSPEKATTHAGERFP